MSATAGARTGAASATALRTSPTSAGSPAAVVTAGGSARVCSAVTTSPLSATQHEDVDGDRLEGGLVEPVDPRRHHTGASVPQAVDDGRLVGAVQPDRVGQVRRPDIVLALAVGAVALRAGVGIDLLAAGKVRLGIDLEARERSHVVGDRVDLGALEHAVAAERRHLGE